MQRVYREDWPKRAGEAAGEEKKGVTLSTTPVFPFFFGRGFCFVFQSHKERDMKWASPLHDDCCPFRFRASAAGQTQ